MSSGASGIVKKPGSMATRGLGVSLMRLSARGALRI
jgi:hypothetical protein